MSGATHESGRTSTVIALLLATVVFTVGEGSIQVLLSPHLEAQGLSQATIGPVVAAVSVAALISRPLVGALYRPRRSRLLILGGCTVSAAAFVGIAVASDPFVLGSLTALNGVGFALSSTAALAAIMDVGQDRDAGALMGWYTGAIGAGHGAAGFLGGLAGDAFGLSRAILTLAVVPLLAGLLLAALLRGIERAPDATGRPTAPTGGAAWRAAVQGFRDVSPVVWLAFAIALHINLLGGVVHTYFPLYGLAIGLSLTQVGALTGLAASLSSVVRFIAPVVFRRFSYGLVNPTMVIAGGLSVAALTLSADVRVLAAVWGGIGLTRGLLRVSSAAMVMETTDDAGGRGAAAGIYLAGLDIGKIVGPLAGGLLIQTWGYETTFVATGLGFAAFYLMTRAFLRVRGNLRTA